MSPEELVKMVRRARHVVIDGVVIKDAYASATNPPSPPRLKHTLKPTSHLRAAGHSGKKRKTAR